MTGFEPLIGDASPSDSLKTFRDKMSKYIDKGEKLDCSSPLKTNKSYHSETSLEVLDTHQILSGEAALPNFQLNPSTLR